MRVEVLGTARQPSLFTVKVVVTYDEKFPFGTLIK